MIRGGSYYNVGALARSALRQDATFEIRTPIVGVRPAMTLHGGR
jgi:hypothetical protein